MKFQTVRGMQDFLPEKARKKQAIEDLIRREFEAYGFDPLETPIVEDFNLLAAKGSAGEEIKNEIYYFKDKSNRELGLRFDLTVPLARVVANNPQLVKPFKRYQIGRVYRYDRPGAKRYREFTQADADIVGSSSVLADFELIALAYKIMKNLGLKFAIKVSNKALLEQIGLACGVKKEQLCNCFRSLDKLDKISEKGVCEELDEKGIAKKIVETIKQTSLEKIEKIVKDKKGYNELKELLDYCEKAAMSEFVKFDASLARGLEYYTGNIFEISCNGVSVGGGGRYDKLIQTYGGPETPAVGISFGIDRLLESLEKQEICQRKARLLVIPIGLIAAAKSLKIARELRSAGLNVENDLMQRSLKKNMEYANKKSIPFVAIIGENELKQKIITIKNMQTGKQQKVKLRPLPKLKKIIGE
ncbi:MAG: histidine--tRNA ligase [Candidatus Diapherotrites archaeon]|nr:histidine--tRNA ligase [Candidatus Diapherotrites archaeon]